MARFPEACDGRWWPEGGGGPRGRAVERPGPRLPAIPDRFVPQVPAQRVVRQPLRMFTQPVHIEPLDRAHDLGVKLAAPVLEQAPVGHLVRERVLEGVLQVREELGLVEELRPRPGPQERVRAPLRKGSPLHQGAEIHPPRAPREPHPQWPAGSQDPARREQAAQHGLPAQRVLWATVELRPRGLGAALLRELAGGAQVAAPRAL